MQLDLLFPLVILRYTHIHSERSLQSIGWQWTGWRTILWGCAGFLASVVIMLIVQAFLGPQFNESAKWQLNFLERIWTLLLLLVITAFGEEMMFRGYLQTIFTNRYGVWIGIGLTALLFGLRHLPMDLYYGISQQASFTAWLSRFMQLYLGAIVFGYVKYRAKSTWASWILHEGLLGVIAGLGMLKLFGVLQ